MPVLESVVANIVSHTSERMRDAQFAQVAVGRFVESQPELASYLSGRSARIGGAQGVLEVAFHAQLICECLAEAHGREPAMVSWRELDRAAQGDVLAKFGAAEPALASYVVSNVEHEAVRLELARVALALARTFE